MIKIIKDRFKAAAVQFKVNNDRIYERRVFSILIEWLMLSFLWNMFYLTYVFKNMIGLNNLISYFSENPVFVIVVIVIIILFDAMGEFLAFHLSVRFVNFIFVGDFTLDLPAVNETKPDGLSKAKSRKSSKANKK